MELNKFAHACFTVTTEKQILVVDPGGFTKDFITPDNTVAIVITHQHADHHDSQLIRGILQKSPEAVIFAPADTVEHFKEFNNVVAVQDGQQKTVGPFKLNFIGERHAIIDSSIPQILNTGVLINNKIYYPGDSFTLPNQPVEILALPVAAPWMKISEALDFARMVKPKLIFPTHDAILSSPGKSIVDRLVTANVPASQFMRLYESIEV